MTGLRESVISALTPYVGEIVADTCVRATALSLGKTADDLDINDLAALEVNARRLLGPVAPREAIDGLIAEIERSLT
ncbi:MAG: hypothetical protein JXE06_08325 [Coriobacteriia bacterium]|nr:hypothetical protein [Coriobacteriia bacterium]MBN2821699.1 hypothetical protein [Coriobacteriia bacterium]